MNKRKKSIYKYIYLILFIVITFLFWYLRLYNFSNLMTFHLDQGLHIQEAWNMVNSKKIQLIGPMVSTRVINGRGFFIGPQYYYLLALFGIITKWNVINITIAFIMLWWIAGFLMFLFLKNRLSPISALFAYGIYSTWPFLVSFSRMFWNPNVLPIISVFYFYSLYMLFNKENRVNGWLWLLLGASTSLGISFHYSVISWLLILLFFIVYLLVKKSLKIKNILLLLLGLIIGNLPIIIFELRHNFYNTKTLILFIKNRVLLGQDAGLTGYYGFSYIILLLSLIAFCLKIIEKKLGKKISLILLILVLSLILSKENYHAKIGIGMPTGWSVKKQKLIGDYIIKELRTDKITNYEVASAISSNLRGDDLRWWLIKAGYPPLGYADYPKADILYLVAYDDLNVANSETWEITSLCPCIIEKKANFNDHILLYKITRTKP